MHYVCEHCERLFEPEDPKKPRCPRCLRAHGVRPHEGSGRRRSGPGAWVLIGAVAVVLAAVGAGVGWKLMAGARVEAPEDPVDAARDRGRALRLAAEARALLEAGDKRAAYKRADEAVRADARVAEARVALGDVLLASQAGKEALAEYVAALTIEESATVHVKAGNLFLVKGVPGQAVRHLTRALELEPNAEWAGRVRTALAALAEGPLPGAGDAASVTRDAGRSPNGGPVDPGASGDPPPAP